MSGPAAIALPADDAALLAPRDDVGQLAATFAAEGRVVVHDLLVPAFADALHRALLDWTRWSLVTRADGQHRRFDALAVEQLPAEGRQALEALVFAEARTGFQYLYERQPLYDPDDASGDETAAVPALVRLRGLLHGGPFIELMRVIAGTAAIDFGDGQLTRYRRGHFLTMHDDAAEGRHRRAAYVLGMTPYWAADDGGQLQFLDAAGQVERSLIPGFNTLALFRVPQPHLVTAVAPFVARSRLSVTGWLRQRG